MLQDISFSTKVLIFAGVILCCFFLDFSYFIIIAFKIAKFRIMISLEKYTYILKIGRQNLLTSHFQCLYLYFQRSALWCRNWKRKKSLRNECKLLQKCSRLNRFIKSCKVVSFPNLKKENKGDETFLINK